MIAIYCKQPKIHDTKNVNSMHGFILCEAAYEKTVSLDFIIGILLTLKHKGRLLPKKLLNYKMVNGRANFYSDKNYSTMCEEHKKGT